MRCRRRAGNDEAAAATKRDGILEQETKGFEHISVLKEEVLEGLNIRQGGSYLDGTLGGAGHAAEILKRAGEGGILYGCDQDKEALAAAEKHLKETCPQGNFRLFHTNYENVVTLLKEEGVRGVDGILLDLGVSSYQLDNADRGFSYREDAPLDMRMDTEQSLTAAQIVNTWEERELFRIIRDYGEELFAKNIAKHIVKRREEKTIETTGELNEIIRAAIPAKMRAEGGHPSKRTFQAIRIACNRELEVLENSLDGMIDLLNPGGRLAVISFHSLEDRIVKNAFRTAESPCICPKSFPVCVCGRVSKGRCVNRKPILPGEDELARNPRSKSSKLRIFEKRED